jgi:hypothetical protein
MKFSKLKYKKLLRSIIILKKEIIFKSGDRIFLSAKNICVRKFCKKLTNRYLDFFQNIRKD